MPHDYDRRTKTAKVMFESVVHKAAEADELVHKAYLSLHSFKFGMDEMEEIPPHIAPLYKQTMTALGKVEVAIDETNQLREMTNKMLRTLGR